MRDLIIHLKFTEFLTLLFLNQGGRDADDVKGLHVVGLALQDMPGIGPHHDAQLIKCVEVLELHVLVFRTHIVIRLIIQFNLPRNVTGLSNEYERLLGIFHREVPIFRFGVIWM